MKYLIYFQYIWGHKYLGGKGQGGFEDSVDLGARWIFKLNTSGLA